MSFFLGIDGGGSKTEWVLADEAGAVLARATTAGANLRRVTPAELRATLRDGVEKLRRTAALPSLAFEAVCAGFAGAGDSQARAMAREVLADLLHPRWLYVVGDMEVALEAAVGAGRGVVLVAGTGSVAYGRNDLGQQARAGGEGPEAGDAGSGYDIGRRALDAARRACSREPQTILARMLRESLETQAIEEIAALVPHVVEAARAGDPTARGILAQAGTALAGLAVTVLRELNLLDTEVRVATTGGVFAASAEVFARVREELGAAAPRATVEPLRVAPAEGAVRLGQRLWLQEGWGARA